MKQISRRLPAAAAPVSGRRTARLALLAVLFFSGATHAAPQPSTHLTIPPPQVRLTAPAAGPTCLGYRVVQPGPVVRNGEVIEFYSYWDRSDYSVTADLDRLDSAGALPVAGEYIGDASVVEGDSVHVWPCYWFTHSVSEENTRADARDLRVPIAATGQSGTTVNEALGFCLANHPPEHLQSAIQGDPRRFVERDGVLYYQVRNGDSIRVATNWRYGTGPLGITADFSALDVEAANRTVTYGGVSADGLAQYWFWYELSDQAHAGSESGLPVEIAAWDGGCGRDSVTLLFEFDNEGPAEPPVLHDMPETVADAQLVVRGRATVEMEDVLLRINGVDRAVEVLSAYDSLYFAEAVTLSAGINTIVAYGRDLVGNLSAASATRAVELVDVPVFKRIVVADPDSTTECTTDGVLAVRNGDLVQFVAYWDSRAEYNVSADLSAIDSAAPAQLWGTLTSNLQVAVGDSIETWYGYQFEYRISANNLLGDGRNRAVPVTATDPVSGHSATTDALRMCLTNSAPVHVWTHILGDSSRFIDFEGQRLFTVRNGGSITLHTAWRSSARPLSVALDLSHADADFLSQRVSAWMVDSLSTTEVPVFGLSYVFSIDACCADGQDAAPIPAVLKTRDTGCGCATVTLLLAMDNEGPAEDPVLSARPPATVTESLILVGGTAPPDVFDVLIEVEHADADSVSRVVTPLYGEQDFSAQVALLPGENELRVFARDAIGNRSPGMQRYQVFLVDRADIAIPKPFRAHDEFVLVNPAGWQSIELRIFNLEGDQVWHYRSDAGPIYRLDAVWDGRNTAGENVRPGPFLLQVRSTDLSGRTHEEVVSFVYSR